MGFIERHGLYDAEQARLAREVGKRIADDGVELVRFSFPDQHGILRGKALAPTEALRALGEGCSITSTLLLKDTSHRSVYPVFSAGGGLGTATMQGGADLIMVADPSSYRKLPWTDGDAWLLCDLFLPDGEPAPYATRQLYRNAVDLARDEGYRFRAGLEVEFHVYRLEDAMLQPEHAGQPGLPGEPPRVSLLTQGYQYLTESRLDQAEPVLALIRRDLEKLGLPVRSVEVEFGPSQFEFTFQAGVGMAPADDMVLMRSAVKQVCRRHGYHATFMCRPLFPNTMASGWHLHQSLVDGDSGTNVFSNESGAAGGALSETGMSYLAGLLKHARAGAALAVPTTSGYSRFRPNSLAPDRVAWGLDNRGVMARVLCAGDATAARIENRIGDPAANPYLYLASQLLAGLDGIRHTLDPGTPTVSPYDTAAEPMPASLGESIDLLESSEFYRRTLGPAFIDYFCFIKRAELERQCGGAGDWEQREYFDIF